MIDLTVPTVVPDATLPRVSIGLEPSAFHRGPNERALILLIDDESLATAEESDVLTDLASHQLIDVTTTTSAALPRCQSIRTCRTTTKLSFEPAVLTAARTPVLGQARAHHVQHGGDGDAVARRFLRAGAAQGHVDAVVLDDVVPPAATRRSAVERPLEDRPEVLDRVRVHVPAGRTRRSLWLTASRN